MDIGTIHGIYTLVFMFAFIGLAVWAYLPSQKESQDNAASLPMDDTDEARQPDQSRRQA